MNKNSNSDRIYGKEFIQSSRNIPFRYIALNDYSNYNYLNTQNRSKQMPANIS